MKVYVASSWKTPRQPEVVARLRALGHEVYDFRDEGFSWASIDPDWESWSAEQARDALAHPLAQAGFNRDMDALASADACVLINPSGRSAHLELGYCIGRGLITVVLTEDGERPDLMYAACHYLLDEIDGLDFVFGNASVGAR